MDTSRIWGGLLCLAIMVVSFIFLWGISVRSYWALAIPVTVGFLGILALGFWIGWTILTIKTAPPSPEPAPLSSAGTGDTQTAGGSSASENKSSSS